MEIVCDPSSDDVPHALLFIVYAVQMSAATVVKRQNQRQKTRSRYSRAHELAAIIWLVGQGKRVNDTSGQ